MKLHALKLGIAAACIGALSSTNVVAQERKAEISGTVYETVQGKNIPLRQATLSIENMGISVATDASGKFIFKDLPLGRLKIHGQFVGKLPVDTINNLQGNQQITLFFKENSFRLDEVGVTAEASNKNMATSSVIGRAAIEHLQANSLADVMSLMPGARASNPDLTNAKQINIPRDGRPNGRPVQCIWNISGGEWCAYV